MSTSTPNKLRGLQVLLVLAGLALGISLSVAAAGRSADIDQAARATDLVVASQDLRAALGAADAASVSAFLAGGVDQPDQRARYGDALTEASDSLRRASVNAEQGDAAVAVGDLLRLLPTYAGLIETARANNRQQLPLGAAYLRSASTSLRTDIVARVDDLGDAGDSSFRSVVGSLTGGVGTASLAVAVVVLALLAIAQRYLQSRTRRRLDRGLVAAAVVVVLGVGWAASSARASARSAADGVVNGYDRLSALSDIRADAYGQQSAATFALVDRGGREGSNATAASAANNVEARLDALGAEPLRAAWAAYRTQSDAATALDLGGNYAAARDRFTAPTSDASAPSGAFARFDAAVVEQVAEAERRLAAGLDDAAGPVGRARIIGLVIGLVVAAAAAWGLQIRINEYR
jgi:hypothetical protein